MEIVISAETSSRETNLDNLGSADAARRPLSWKTIRSRKLVSLFMTHAFLFKFHMYEREMTQKICTLFNSIV